MRVFLTGATGWIGSAVARDLIEAGHSVVGLVRSVEKGEAIRAAGVVPLLGSLADLDVLREGASGADGVVHTAFGLDVSNYRHLIEEDRKAIETFADVYAGSNRPIVVTSGLGMLPARETLTEDARPAVVAEYPRVSEQTAFALADHGARLSVVRPARSVHAVGERHGFVPMLADIARRTGVSAYVGDGQGVWPAVHRSDAARLFRLALEKGARNEAFHAVTECVPFRLVAEAIGRQVGVPTKSLTREAAKTHFGDLSLWVTGGGFASSAWTQATLGWKPREIGLLADIDRPDYLG